MNGRYSGQTWNWEATDSSLLHKSSPVHIYEQTQGMNPGPFALEAGVLPPRCPVPLRWSELRGQVCSDVVLNDSQRCPTFLLTWTICSWLFPSPSKSGCNTPRSAVQLITKNHLIFRFWSHRENTAFKTNIRSESCLIDSQLVNQINDVLRMIRNGWHVNIKSKASYFVDDILLTKENVHKKFRNMDYQ